MSSCDYGTQIGNKQMNVSSLIQEILCWVIALLQHQIQQGIIDVQITEFQPNRGKSIQYCSVHAIVVKSIVSKFQRTAPGTCMCML